MHQKLHRYLLLYMLVLFSCSLSKPGSDAASLFVSSAFTSINSFTKGVEGPAVDINGNLYAVNFQKQGTIGMVTPAGNPYQYIELPAGSIGNGIRFNQKGEMFVADYLKHNIFKIDPHTKQISVYAHEPLMSQPNDIAIDSKGIIYASDPDWKSGTGRIWRIDTNGKVTLLESNMGTTNGIEVNPDEKILYVNETTQRKVWAYDLSGNGNISNKRLLIQFPDFGMDGMRCDSKGNLYITRNGKGTVVKVSPEGTLLKEIILSGKKPSNIAFGGKDGRQAFVTVQDNGNIESFRVDYPGREWKMNK